MEPPVVLTGNDAGADRVRAALDAFESARARGDLGPGDTVVLLLESHALVFDRATHLLGADVAGAFPPAPTIPADLLTDRLAALADYGCRVLVLLDSVHEAQAAPTGWDSRVAEWARVLTRRNVITFLASIQGPSRRLLAEGHGAFAHAVLTYRDAGSQTRLITEPNRPVTLGQFGDIVEQSVGRLTGLSQVARCYVPGTIPARTTVFAPPSRIELAAREDRPPPDR